ncbi:synaptobrevin-domain-containing protein [Pyronema domesticum]|uniref:Synaptobrevin homolog YKT6 n=1 Tax=Pyronema omphalodes (strain CBS 100304) TaxID=1076935 RepID=U4LJI1_PYROM|nr:synaptobrevin-domain-containing protein [Pyronema domesticum]CCX32108.1 Similar to Vesicle-associated membrane protein 711; acc. no. O49377 [Pyronema omphalodes CBS 100304]
MSSSSSTPLLYSCIAHGTTILCEHSSPGTASVNASSLAAIVLPKIPHDEAKKLTYTHGPHNIHFIATASSSVLPQGLSFIVISPSSVTRKLPFGFLIEIQKLFLARYTQSSLADAPPYGCAEFNSVLKSTMARFSQGGEDEDVVIKAQREIESVRGIMTENIERVLERGERIDLLVDKTAGLQTGSREFRVRSRGLRRRMWWKNTKLMMLLVFVCIFLLYLFVGFGCGLPGWQRCV